MADGKELKPKSFRIDDETAEKFKEISNTIGGNQQEALAKLIEAYEMQAGKAVLVDRKCDIEQFEAYMSSITRMYMGSLEDGQNARETARMEFDALLKSKDMVIQDLQEELANAKKQKDAAIEESKSKCDECSRLEGEITAAKEQMKNLQAALSDKEHLNKALTDSCNDLKARVEGMGDIIKLQEELAHLQEENIKLERLAESQKEQAKIETEKALLKQEKEFQERLRKEADKYSQALVELFGKLRIGAIKEEPQPEKLQPEEPQPKKASKKKSTTVKRSEKVSEEQN